MLGNPCDLDDPAAIAAKHKLVLIEDAAQAFGGSYKGKQLGTMGRIGIYSFNIFKTINAGDGGMVVTDDDELYFRAFGYHDQGHFPSRSGVEVGNRSIIGQNYRMNEITGAVLIAQFRRLDDIIVGCARSRPGSSRRSKGLQGSPSANFTIRRESATRCSQSSSREQTSRKSWRRSSARRPYQVGLARVQQHGADPRQEDDHRARLPVQLLVLPLPAGIREGNAPANGRHPRAAPSTSPWVSWTEGWARPSASTRIPRMRRSTRRRKSSPRRLRKAYRKATEGRTRSMSRSSERVSLVQCT